jgi:hypothetical protein
MTTQNLRKESRKSWLSAYVYGSTVQLLVRLGPLVNFGQ